MTSRPLRWLQPGYLTPLAAVVALTSLGAAVLSLPREEPQGHPGAGPEKPRPVPGLAVALAAGESLTCIPTAAHVAGAAGTNWRTDLQIHNPGATQAAYSIALLKHAEANLAPATQSFTLAPGQAVRYRDIVAERFAYHGKAALRVTATSGTVVVTSRTYNDQPSGTYGQFVPAIPDGAAITAEQEGRLIQLSHQPNVAAGGFRTNIGVVNAGSDPIAVTVDLFTSAGAHLGQLPMTLRGYEYLQIDRIFERVTAGAVADGYAVVRTSTSGGRLFAYASVIDNRTGDPIFIPAARLARSPATPTPPPPTPTPTAPPPTPTPTAPPSGTVNLARYTPPGWPNCVVANYRHINPPPVTEALYINQPTYIYWAIANFGTATFTGPLKFGYYLDGTRIFDATWSNPNGLPANHYVTFNPISMTVRTAGQHTLEVRIDPDNTVAETTKSDNSCSFTGTWGAAPLGSGNPVDAAANRGDAAVTVSPPMPIGHAASHLMAGTHSSPATYYVGTSAHATGAAGTNWRTDLQLHNPGTTPASYSIALLKHATDNTSPQRLTVTVPPGQAVRYHDAVFSLFGFNGKAALRLEVTTGSLVAASRTYNDQPGGTYGQFVPAIPAGEAVTDQQEGRLIQLSHQPNVAAGGFRTNLGVVNAGSATIAVTIDLFSATGGWLGQLPMTLRGYEYLQIDKVFERVTSAAVGDGYAVVRTSSTGGRFFAYASVIDNRTGDPVYIPAAVLPRGAAPPTPTPTATPAVITGPGGTSITLPQGGTTPNATITLTAGSGADLPKAGETLVSTVIKVNIGGEGSSTGAGPYLVKIPVTGPVGDPSRLLLKVQTSAGPVYPVAGAFDPASRVFTAELMRLWNGWNMGVVARPNLWFAAASPDDGGDAVTLSWVTPMDWQTCSWSINASLPSGPATNAFAADVKTALVKACQHLSGAGFRSPKLWVDGRLNPRARVAHIVEGTGPTDPTTSFRKISEEDPLFSHLAFNDEQMHSLGQLYFNWDEWQNAILPAGLSIGHVAIHELFHGVQYGYDIRQRWLDGKSPLQWVKEGTATVIGMTYQTNPNGINGGPVTVRPLEPPQVLDEQLHAQSGIAAYARQDFFAYLAKRYAGGSFRHLADLFQHLADVTEGKFGLSLSEYVTLYRRGLHAHLSRDLGVSLSDAYAEFAVDRAYRHHEPALLRSADWNLPMGSLDRSLFRKLTTWDPSAQAVLSSTDWDSEGKGVRPLQTWAIKVNVPASARSAGALVIPIKVDLVPLSRDGVRIFVFRESGGVQIPNGEMEITDISQPVSVPVNSSIQTLTILVINGSIENRWAEVTFGQQPWTRVSLGYTEVHVCNNPPSCTERCATRPPEEGPAFVEPITWSNRYFSFEVPGLKIDGELSPDGETVIFHRVIFGNEVTRHFLNLPKIPARSTPDLAVFGVAGQQALLHIVDVRIWGCSSSQAIIDTTKPLILELWLAR